MLQLKSKISDSEGNSSYVQDISPGGIEFLGQIIQPGTQPEREKPNNQNNQTEAWLEV